MHFAVGVAKFCAQNWFRATRAYSKFDSAIPMLIEVMATVEAAVAATQNFRYRLWYSRGRIASEHSADTARWVWH